MLLKILPKELRGARKNDKERKKLERDYRKFFQRGKYEKYKKKDRERSTKYNITGKRVAPSLQTPIHAI